MPRPAVVELGLEQSNAGPAAAYPTTVSTSEAVAAITSNAIEVPDNAPAIAGAITQPEVRGDITKRRPARRYADSGPRRAIGRNRTRYVQPRAPRDEPEFTLSDGLAAGDAFMERVAESIDLDVSGKFGIEGRTFFQDPLIAGQPSTTGSISVQPEFYFTWDNDNQSLLVVPFARYDAVDSRRTHADLREFSYIYAAREWELRTGVRKVFWGVAESNHLVDIINQTDLVENIDQEDKLGQPMVNLAIIRDWGTVDLFVLPGFRERTFPGREGRFQGPVRMASADAVYESAAEQAHVDYAARYSHYFGTFDVGLSHFWGTSREPRFGTKIAPSGVPVLFPVYDLIHQTGIDVQSTVDSWLFKFEALRRQGQGETYTAAVGGFEYTYVGVFETPMDVGVIGEYHWDERGKSAVKDGLVSFVPFNDDIFIGSRLAFNDAADSQILGGMVSDLNGDGHFLNIEASRRLGDAWKIELEMRWLVAIDPANPLFSLNRDDHVQLELSRFF